MNLGAMNDRLPTYPSNIQGELRLILQTKDIFMVCYRQLEEYRRLVNEQNRLITKEFVQDQLKAGEDEINELKLEMAEAENKLESRLKHNEILADQLTNQTFNASETGVPTRHLSLARGPQARKQMLAQRKANSDICSVTERSQTHLIDNIALAIDEIHQEVRTKVKPLLDYYRDLFYLQLHFSLILGQVCNYCMPLVTENIGLLERVFFWAERPEFELIRKASDISDRLKEIYTRAQQIYSVLSESVRFLQSKVELQKSLEARFHERTDEHQKIKDKILREIHGTKQNMDFLEEENDRLVGSLVKLDPNFVDSQNFADFAEQGRGFNGRKFPEANNAGAQDDTDLLRLNTNENAGADFNNNKAMSVNCDSDATIIAPAPSKKPSTSKSDKATKIKKQKARGEEKPNRNREEQESDDERTSKTKCHKSRKSKSTRPGCREQRRAASSGTEGTRSHSRKRRSPSVKRSGSRRPSKRLSDTSERLDTEFTRPRSELLSNFTSTEKTAKTSLKSRLLDRTKGLFDLSRAKNSDEDASYATHQQAAPPNGGDSALTSISTVSGFEQPETKDRSESRRGKKQTKSRRKNSTGGFPEFEQLRLRDEDMLVLNDRSPSDDANNDRKRRSKSRTRSRHNALADFLSSSASDTPSNADHSVLPAL